MIRKQKLTLKQHKHTIDLHFLNVPQGPVVYLICFEDTDKYYVGGANNCGDRIQGHFTHPLTSSKKDYYIYKEALSNKIITIRTIAQCESVSEAFHRETYYIKEFKKLLGNKLLNLKI